MTKLSEVEGLRVIQTGPFGTQLKAEEYDSTSCGAAVVSVGEIREGYIRLRRDTPRVGDEVQERLRNFVLDDRDVVVSRKGTVDRSAWVSKLYGPLFLGSDAIAVRFWDAATARFYAYALQDPTVRRWLVQHAPGTTMLSMNGAVLGAVPVPTFHRMQMAGVVDVLGALDSQIVSNRVAASKSRDLAGAVVAATTRMAKLGDLARAVRKSIDPSSLEVDSVKHFSLPAFDAGAATEVSPATIMSAKNLLQEPVVLVSKLNPRIPRIWAVDKLPTSIALASTEFVALAPRRVGIGALWASLLDPRFTQSVLERTAGTTGSHQRVKPEQMLDVEVRDVRELGTERRELLESLCRKVNDVADENQRLAATRDELLPLLMSGKITVKDAEKTVEGVL